MSYQNTTISASQATKAPAPSGDFALAVENLSLAYRTANGLNQVLKGVDLALKRGEILGLVGESGCGKSTTALAAIGYRAPGVEILSGKALFGDTDLMQQPQEALRNIWGHKVAFVSQHASLALNPSITIGRQLADPMEKHLKLRGRALRERQLDLLRRVEIPDPDPALARFPFQFSGGQQQRVAIAIALSCDASVLVLDEPTTGLDPTTQASFSRLLKGLARERQTSVIYVSHDLALLHEIADRIAVMYAGEVVETGPASALVGQPRHPYTRALMQTVPSLVRPGFVNSIPGQPPASIVADACAFAPRCAYAEDACTVQAISSEQTDAGMVRCRRHRELPAEPSDRLPLQPGGQGEIILSVKDLVCSYSTGARPAVGNVSLELRHGETLGIVGESGSGKSTLLRAIGGLVSPVSGDIAYRGAPLAGTVSQRPRQLRGQLQMVFQNPDSSLNPRHTIRHILRRPLRLFRPDLSRQAEEQEILSLLDSVRLPSTLADRLPGELSGGQKQRIAIARAFAAQPAVLLCDEITSALDVSVQASILELLADLSQRTGVATIFVSHDLPVVRSLAARTMVMRNGEVLESGETAAVLVNPHHEYTQKLLAAVHDLPPREVTHAV